MCRRASLTSWLPMVRPPWSSAVSSAITFSATPTSSSVPLMVNSPSRATNRTWRRSSTIRICSSFRPKRAWISAPEGRGPCHEALNPLRLREGDHLADRVGPRQQHDEAVEPEGDSPMGRGAEFEGLQEEPEPLPRLLRAEPEGIEHLLLSLPVVVSDAAATQLVAIDHEVVRLGPHRLGGALEQREILVPGGGEGGGGGH